MISPVFSLLLLHVLMLNTNLEALKLTPAEFGKRSPQRLKNAMMSSVFQRRLRVLEHWRCKPRCRCISTDHIPVLMSEVWSPSCLASWSPCDSRRHRLLLVVQVLAALKPEDAPPQSLFIDCTVGCGGHASAILAANPSLHLLGLDKDPVVSRRRCVCCV
jgi:MraW methylase family